MTRIKAFKSLLFILFISILSSCNSDDNSVSEGNDQTSQETITTKERLVGEWKLISSTIDNKNISPSEFECLKNSIATFTQDDTYELTFLKLGNNSTNLCSQTSIQSGTYTVIGLNSVTFFNSTSEIKLIDNTLQITSKITDDNEEKDQIDIFIRSDNTELEESSAEETNDLETDESETDDNNEENNTFDGTEVIKNILGKWKIESNQDCFQKNTIEFKLQNAFEFIQHKKTFTRRDLLNYNIGMSYPLPENIEAEVTKGSDMVVFDTNAECQFIKTSNLEYVVKDEKTVVLKNIPGIRLILEDNNTIKLVYTFNDSNANEQVKEFVYKKL